MRTVILSFAAFILSFTQVNAQWIDLSPNLPDSIENISDISFLTEEIGLISCKNLSIWPNFQRYIYRTTDGGETWLVSFHDIVNQQENYKFNFINSDTGWAFAQNILLKTIDGGQSWVQNELPLESPPFQLTILSAHFINDSVGWVGGRLIWNNYPYLTYNDVIYKTSDSGTNWSRVLTYQAVTGISKIFFTPGNRGYATNSTFFYRTSNGIDWAKINTISMSDFIFTDQSNGWAVGFDNTNSKISKTSNSGNTWNQQYILPDTALNRLFFLNSMKGICVGDHGKILFTSDGGLNWKNEFIGSNCSLRAINFPDEQIGYCGGQNYLFKTTNGGSIDNQITFSEDSIYIPTLGDTGSVKILNTSDHSVRIDSIISVGAFYGYRGHLSKPGFEYPFYLFQTLPSPQWNDTLGIVIPPHDSINVSFYEVDLCPICDYEVQEYFEDTLRFVFTFMDGNVYSFSKSIPISGEGHPSDVKGEDVLPNEFSLSQNYPNPFNPSTRIKYAISSRQYVTLKVYDVLGNEVSVLVNEEKFLGSYEINFSATGGASKLSSGVYYYQLRAGSLVQTKKMIYLK